MGEAAGTVVAAAGMFVGTDLDDLVVLTVLFLAARSSGWPRPWQIWAGQYLGIGALVLVAGIAALGLTIVPERWVGLLGLIPLGLGVAGLARAVRHRDGDARPAAPATGLLSVAGVTIANGADNLTVYPTAFRALGPAGTLVALAVFAVGVAVWCLAGSWLGGHPKAVEVVEAYGQWIVPAVFVVIGVVVLSTLGRTA